VLLDVPHERAWREAIADFVTPALFTSALYATEVAGKPRMTGALAALHSLGVNDARQKAQEFADKKHAAVMALMQQGHVKLYLDATRFIQAVSTLGWPLAVVSASLDAAEMLRLVPMEGAGTLADKFAASVCGRDLKNLRPHPEMFLLAAVDLDAPPEQCFVVEDSVRGIQAGRAAGMAVLGLARDGDSVSLYAAGADLVVRNLDEVDIKALQGGKLRRRK